MSRHPWRVVWKAGTSVDGERALLDQARVALVAGEAGDVLAALERYARIYRRPRLGEEHDALEIQALVRAGRYDEAHARADAFLRATPRSLFVPAVDAAIRFIRIKAPGARTISRREREGQSSTGWRSQEHEGLVERSGAGGDGVQRSDD